MDDRYNYSEAMGSYMAQKLQEAIRSAKRRSGTSTPSTGSATPASSTEQPEIATQHPPPKSKTQIERQRSQRHDEKMNHQDSCNDSQNPRLETTSPRPQRSHDQNRHPHSPHPRISRSMIQQDASLTTSHRKVNDPPTPYANSPMPITTPPNPTPTSTFSPSAASSEAILDCEEGEDDDDDDDDDESDSHSASAERDVEDRLESLTLNRTRSADKRQSGREMVQEHVLLVEAWKTRERKRLGSVASNGEGGSGRRSWSVS